MSPSSTLLAVSTLGAHHNEALALGGAFVVLLLTFAVACVCLVHDRWCHCKSSRIPRGTNPATAEASNGFDEEIRDADDEEHASDTHRSNSQCAPCTGCFKLFTSFEERCFQFLEGDAGTAPRKRGVAGIEVVDDCVDTDRRANKDEDAEDAEDAEEAEEAEEAAEAQPAPRKFLPVKQKWRRGVRSGGRTSERV